MVKIGKEELQLHVEFVPLKLIGMISGEKTVNPDEHRSLKSDERELIAQDDSKE